MRGSVALTECFIADMDSQMRERRFGDPSIGKQSALDGRRARRRGRPLAPYAMAAKWSGRRRAQSI